MQELFNVLAHRDANKDNRSVRMLVESNKLNADRTEGRIPVHSVRTVTVIAALKLHYSSGHRTVTVQIFFPVCNHDINMNHSKFQ
jgi:hypothetical protein